MLRIKLIKENNAKLTGIQDYNLKFMSQNKWDTSQLGASIMSSFGNDIQVVEELITKIPQLSKYKIKRAIAGESFGKVFLLDGLDHILKIFSQSLSTDEDMAWYRECQSKLHSGKAKITTLPVYDTGEVIIKNTKYFYVLMAKFMTISEYFTDRAGDTKTAPKGTEELKRDFNKIKENYKLYYSEYSKQVYYLKEKLKDAKYFSAEEVEKMKEKLVEAEEDLRWFLSRDGKAIANDLLYPVDKDGKPIAGLMKILFEFSENDVKSLIETLHHLIQDGYKFKDIYMKNVGVLEQTSKRRSPTFIIFDN